MQTARASPWGGGGGGGMRWVSGPHQVPETCDFNYPGHVTAVLGTPQPHRTMHHKILLGRKGGTCEPPGLAHHFWREAVALAGRQRALPAGTLEEKQGK